MGQSSKKKKCRRGGSRKKGILPSKDRISLADDYTKFSEEITTLRATWEGDCKVDSESPPEVNINLRPYSKDTGYEDSDVSALLSVRCVPGYPDKSPKLQIISEKGLSKADAEKLLSLLHDQANENSRAGQVMIYDLVAAAREFLSEIALLEELHESVPFRAEDKSSLLYQNNVPVVCDKNCSSTGPFVYGFQDLFSGSGESCHWGLAVEESNVLNSSLHSQKAETIEQKIDQTFKQLVIKDTKQGPLITPTTAKLDTLEDESRNTDTRVEMSMPTSESTSSDSMIQDQLSQTSDIDIIMAHLLRLACAPKGPLADALTEVTSELYDLRIISDSVKDLATKPHSKFDRIFHHVYGQRMVSSKISQFWKAAPDFEGQNSSSIQSSRYLSDFEELQYIGHGGFARVVLCKNKVDERQYAMKKIRIKYKSKPVNDRILREVATLSRLQHHHVVRYYQAWFETGLTAGYGDTVLGSKTAMSLSFTHDDSSSAEVTGNESKESTYLYIQMEYCPRTLQQMFDSYTHVDKELAWHVSRQILEGLEHIHGHGIIHRDLTPNNIFFDAHNDIKIGDFGLAKFLMEQPEQELDPSKAAGVSGQVGTYFYTAPEIEQRCPKVNEKADMYSFGIVFLELWHPFTTNMERNIVLSDLKMNQKLPSEWVAEFPEQASLLQRLMSLNLSDRPSATELLQHDFPPRMVSELLDSFLRTMHTSEDISIHDKVVNAIFDAEMLSTKHNHQAVGRLKVARNDISSIQYTDVDTKIRDQLVKITTEVFRQHCAKHLEVKPMWLFSDSPQLNNRNVVKLLTSGGDMIELCQDLRLPFAKWVVTNQKSSFKRYEVACVHRKAIGHSTPNRYLQGDFDIIGGASALTEAEVVKAAIDIVSRCFNPESCELHLNHGDLLDAMWSWIGIKADHRQKVAELLSLLGSLRPQSSERKFKWVVIRRLLQQELNLAEAALNRLQTVGLRLCGVAKQALPRLRGALAADEPARKALDELWKLFSYLDVWGIDKHVFIDPLMPPTESYHRNLFFQMYLRKENSPAEGTLLAVGGRYDSLLQNMWDSQNKSNPPGAVGTSLSLETILHHSSVDIEPFRNYVGISVLICSKGGDGLLKERMKLVAELWDKNIKAEFVPLSDPSLAEQYEFANEHDIKCLVIITGKKDSVQVHHLELDKEKEVKGADLINFLSEALATQFRNPSIWN